METHWQEPWGDRRQEIVFIGTGINWMDIASKLDAALIPEGIAQSVQELPEYSDPFPNWTQAAA